MERGVNVNDLPAHDRDAGSEELFPVPAPAISGAPDLGPCLYLGPAGQRCSRRAVEGGFCAVHQPGATVRKIATKRSRVLAILGMMGILWPYIVDLIREITRWLHSH